MLYWIERVDKQNAILFDKTVAQTESQLQRYYKKAAEDTIRDIERLYDQLLKESEDGQIKVNDLYRFNRYFEIMSNINKRLMSLGQKEIRIDNKQLLNMYDSVQENLTALSPSGISKSFVTNNAADNVINTVWCSDGKHWSDRIWSNKQALQQAIEKGLIDNIVRGESKDKVVQTIQEQFNVGFRQSDRIVRTETAYVQNQSTLDRYKAAGVKKYKILAALDSRTSDICKHQNGKVYDIDKAKVGVNMPPFHPNCRTTIIPLLEV